MTVRTLLFLALVTVASHVPAADIACIQVITKARNPATDQIKSFATPCDVPFGWVVLSPKSLGQPALAVLEDAEHGTLGRWRKIGRNSNAELKNQWDERAGSLVMRLLPGDTAKGVKLPIRSVVGTQRMLVQWRQRFWGAYQVSWRVQGAKGLKYRLTYGVGKAGICSKDRASKTLSCGLGERTDNNQWRRFTRNLKSDLRKHFPTARPVRVLSLEIRGNGAFDDVRLATDRGQLRDVPNLQRFASHKAFANYLRQTIKAERSYLKSLPVFYTSGAVNTSFDSANPEARSSTNLQELGVDEADRVKSDGDKLYLLGYEGNGYSWTQGVRVMALQDPPAESTEIAYIELPNQSGGADLHYQGLYLAADSEGIPDSRLLVVGSSRDWGPVYFTSRLLSIPTGGNKRARTELSLFDVSTPADPMEQHVIAIDGHLLASRRIDRSLYLVTRRYPFSGSVIPLHRLNETAENAGLSNRRLVELTLPDWYLDGESQGNLVSYDACFRPGGVANGEQPHNIMVVARIDLDDPTAPPTAACIIGTGQTVYASPKGLYLSSTGFDSSEGLATTEIYKFALQTDGPEYRGSIQVQGNLGWETDKQPFRFSEHQGVLRVVTSSGNTWDGTATTHLTTAAEQGGAFKVLAELPNNSRPEALGKPGERLYAVRYLADRAYLVTFQVTDPLYVINLSNPRDPYIAGELQIPGYSDYLHPLSGDRLLGIGKHAVAARNGDDQRGAWYQGVKLSLFDISDETSPVELDSLILGERGSSSDLLYDHHALALLAGTSGSPDRLALPIRLHDTLRTYLKNNPDKVKPWTWYDWTHTGLYLFELRDDRIEENGALVVEQSKADDDSSDTTAAALPGLVRWREPQPSDRALIINDSVHYVHGSNLWSADWSTPENWFGPN